VVEPHVRDITIDPDDPDTIYAALQVGYMLKSQDGGETWRLLREGFDCDVHTIVLDPGNSKRVVIATGGGDSRSGRAPGKALYKSDDAAATWKPIAMNFELTYSNPLVVDPRNANTMYSAVSSGPPSRRNNPDYRTIMIRSQDGGESWTEMDLGDVITHDFPEGIVIDSEAGGRVYVGLQGGNFLASDDAGDSWEPIDLKLDGVESVKLTHV
jgi:photosystem II stability/assembly factor-like uncharacterized protein